MDKGMNNPIHIISFGAGVQSSTMALMAARGELTPMPSCGIFADTQAEPKSVYDWLDYIEKLLPFPIYRITFGSLLEKSLVVRTSKTGSKYTKHSPPAYIIDTEGKSGILMRQCTADSKIEIIQKKIREIVDKKGMCIQWIGISIDEAIRIKPSRKKYIKNIWPLVNKEISRGDCIKWMKKNGFPEPPRSACSFCPYHDDAEWIRLRDKEPEAFQQAIDYEKRLQATMIQVNNFRGVPWLHRSHVPLEQVKFNPKAKKERHQSNFNFGNECEGMCGV